MKRRTLYICILLLLFIAGGYLYWQLTASSPAQRQSGSTRTASLPAAGSEDDTTRKALLGIWEDDYQGKRTMTLKPDGTGTMLVELKGMTAVLYAAKLRFDMTWSLDGKKFTKKTIGGEPASKVNLILNTMGDTAADTIVELTSERLLLLDKDGKTQYDWRRVNPP